MNNDNATAHLAMDERLFLGEGLFETIKISRYKPCFPDLHWERLCESANQLGIPFLLTKEDWCALLMGKIQQEQLSQGGIKVILTGGRAPRGLLSQGSANQLLLQSFSYEVNSKPLFLITASWLRDRHNPIYLSKSISYLEAISARRNALQQGADDALFFNTQGHASEATCANLFIVYQGRLLTPPEYDGILPGITRCRVLRHCVGSSIDHEELSITKEMLYSAEAIFLTSSLQGIQYVGVFDKHRACRSHPLVERLKCLLSTEEGA
jgi:4-amino-4-deoxychorismate lyase